MGDNDPRSTASLGQSIPSGRPGTLRQRPHRASSAAQNQKPGAVAPPAPGGRPSTGAGPQGAPAATNEEQEAREVQNQRAMEVLARVKEKLTGRDFPPVVVEDDENATVATIPATAVSTDDTEAQTLAAQAGPRPIESLRVDVQVDKLIREATNLENLCQHYIGWCSFW
jgi:FKBP12-rapamycin complex-associated protein